MNIVLTNATDIYSGGEEYVLILARHLRRRGHTVAVSALPGHLLLRKCALEGIDAIPVEYSGMSRVFGVGRDLRRHLLSRSADIVHSNANYDRTAAAIAAAFTKVKHVAGVHSAHSIQHNLTHWARNRWGIDHFITDADAGKDVLVHIDRLPASRITTVPIGFEEMPQAFRTEARERTRALLGVAGNTVIIGNVARLVPFKGHRHLLDAVALVIREESDVLVLIAGDGELQDTLVAQARLLGIEGYIRFLGFRDDLDELYPAFDIYCHSSLEMAAEMFPIAVIRSLASDLPAVCTRVGGISHMVRDGASGFLVPPGEPGALAAALLRLVRDPALRTAMGRASSELFRRQYHAAMMAEAMEQVYRSLLP